MLTEKLPYLVAAMEWLLENPERWGRYKTFGVRDGEVCFCVWGLATALEHGWWDGMTPENVQALMAHAGLPLDEDTYKAFKRLAFINDRHETALGAVTAVAEYLGMEIV